MPHWQAQLQLDVPYKNFALALWQQDHQTQEGNKILYEFSLWLLISRDGDVAKLSLPLSIYLYSCMVTFLLKGNDNFIDFRWDVP